MRKKWFSLKLENFENLRLKSPYICWFRAHNVRSARSSRFGHKYTKVVPTHGSGSSLNPISIYRLCPEIEGREQLLKNAKFCIQLNRMGFIFCSSNCVLKGSNRGNAQAFLLVIFIVKLVCMESNERKLQWTKNYPILVEVFMDYDFIR